MTKSAWVSSALISCALAALAASGATMISYVQWDVRSASMRHAPGAHFIFENVIHEAGFARLAVAMLGLLVVIFPFRRGERWAWLALAALLGGYLVPVFVLPAPLPRWAELTAALRQAGPARMALPDLVFPFLFLLGLLVSLPSFVWRKRVRVPKPRPPE